MDPSNLLARANAALAADRAFAPAGDSALEGFLAVIRATEAGAAQAGETRRGPRLADVVNDGDLASQARLALNDLFPYGTAWVEQALQRGEHREAERVLALLEHVQPGAPALQRLRQALAAATAPTPSRALASAPARALPPSAPPRAASLAPAAAVPPVASPPSVPPAASDESAGTLRAPAPTSIDAPGALDAAPVNRQPDPVLLNRVTPRYPARAMRQKLEGWVAVRLLVNAEGEVIDSEVDAAEPEGVFEREALAAAQRWRFSATGSERWVARRIDFRLTR